MYAASKNFPDIAAELLVAGADDKILNSEGKNALQLAMDMNNEDVVEAK